MSISPEGPRDLWLRSELDIRFLAVLSFRSLHVSARLWDTVLDVQGGHPVLPTRVAMCSPSLASPLPPSSLALPSWGWVYGREWSLGHGAGVGISRDSHSNSGFASGFCLDS